MNNRYENVAAQIRELIKNRFFDSPGLITDSLVTQLKDLIENSDRNSRSYGLLHLGKFICEGRVKNQEPLQGIEYFKTLVQEEKLREEGVRVISKAVQQAALSAKTHEAALDILKKAYATFDYGEILALTADCLLTGNYSPIQKKPTDWIVFICDLINTSMVKNDGHFGLYISHVLSCAATFNKTQEAIKILSNSMLSEVWSDEHTLLLQGTMMKLSAKYPETIITINADIGVIDESALNTNASQNRLT